MEYWDRHRVILRVRDLRAEEGDDRFWAVRRRGYAAIIPELTDKIEEAQLSGGSPRELKFVRGSSGRDGDAGATPHLPVGVPASRRDQGSDGGDARGHPVRDGHRPPELRPADQERGAHGS